GQNSRTIHKTFLINCTDLINHRHRILPRTRHGQHNRRGSFRGRTQRNYDWCCAEAVYLIGRENDTWPALFYFSAHGWVKVDPPDFALVQSSLSLRASQAFILRLTVRSLLAFWAACASVVPLDSN